MTTWILSHALTIGGALFAVGLGALVVVLLFATREDRAAVERQAPPELVVSSGVARDPVRHFTRDRCPICGMSEVILRASGAPNRRYHPASECAAYFDVIAAREPKEVA